MGEARSHELDRCTRSWRTRSSLVAARGPGGADDAPARPPSLDVGTPTIYWHVGSRDELVAAGDRAQAERLAERTGRGTPTAIASVGARCTSTTGAIEQRAITSRRATRPGTSSLLLHRLEDALVDASSKARAAQPAPSARRAVLDRRHRRARADACAISRSMPQDRDDCCAGRAATSTPRPPRRCGAVVDHHVPRARTVREPTAADEPTRRDRRLAQARRHLRDRAAEGSRASLPPGIEPIDPTVTVGFYCVPVLGEPELGVSVKIEACRGRACAGHYTPGLGIDQEAAPSTSARRPTGNRSSSATSRTSASGDAVTARATPPGVHVRRAHRHGRAGEVPLASASFVEHEWWTKYSAAIGGAERRATTSPPHVVDVATTVRAAPRRGRRRRRSCCATARGIRSPATSRRASSGRAQLGHATSRRRGASPTPVRSTPSAFWPFADVIGGSRWPGRARRAETPDRTRRTSDGRTTTDRTTS